MNILLTALGLACAPLLGLVGMFYLLGRHDGREAEKRRRAHAADGLIARKNREGCIRL